MDAVTPLIGPLAVILMVIRSVQFFTRISQ